MHSTFAILGLATALALAPNPAAAACSTPTGSQGEIIYNYDYGVVQFCDGSNWISMASSGSMVETDPKVGALTGSNFCKANSGGTAIVCSTAAVSLSTDASGTLQAAQFPALTGVVTTSAGSLTTSIGAGAITNTMLAGSIALSKLSLTGTPDGTKFLRDDGQWATIGGGTVTGAGGAGYVPIWSSASALTYDSTAGGQFVWDTTNHRLGIGTATPAYSLDVNGAANISGSSTNQLNVVTTSTTAAAAAVTGTASGASGSIYGGYFSSAGASGAIGVYGNSTGGTGVRGYGKFHGGLFTGTDPTGDAISAVVGNAAAKGIVITGAASQTGALLLMQDSASSTLSVFNASGALGIGTGAPGTALHVYGSGDREARIQSSSNGNAIVGLMPNGGGVGQIKATGSHLYLTSTTNDVELQPGGAMALVAKSGGNVAIGTTTAGQKLTVAGTVESTSGGFKFPDGSTQTTASTGGVTGGSAGYVPIWSSATALTYDATAGGQFVWDSANHRLGIGLASPDAALTTASVTATGQIAAHFMSSTGAFALFTDAGAKDWAIGVPDASNAFAIYEDRNPGGAGSERFRIAAGGNVGIGTASPSQKLSVYGSTPVAYFHDTTNSRGATFGVGDGWNAVINASAGNVILQVGGTSWLTVARSGTSTTFDTGNVGIGYAAPAQKLHVRTATQGTDGLFLDSAVSGGNVFLRPNSSSGASNGIVQAGDAAIVYSSSSGIGTGALSITPWASATSGIRMDASGNVGIGTASPGTLLQLLGGNDADQLRISNWSSAYFSIGRVAATGALSIQGTQTGANNITLAPTSGNVGIGTTAPGQKLSVAGTIESTTGGFKFPDGTTQTTAGGGGGLSGGSAGYVPIWSGASALTYDATAGGQLVWDSTNHRLGVGTSTPGLLLDVNGDARVRNTFYVSSNNMTGGGIKLADDGDIVDMNDGYATMRFSSGVRLTNANAAGSTVIQLGGGSGVTYFNSGNVGIGTASPSVLLELSKADPSLRFSGSNNARVYSALPLYINPDGSQPTYINYNNGGHVILQGYPANAGNVGIGVTNPGYKLDVSGSANFSGSIYFPTGGGNNFISAGTGDGASYSTYNFALNGWWGMALKDYSGAVHGVYDFRSGNWTTDGVISFAGTGNNYLAGKLGIGNSSPNGRLQVSGTIDGNDAIVFRQNADNSHSIQTYIDGQWANRTTYASGCCNPLLIQPDVGYVAVGTASPLGHRFQIENSNNPGAWVALGVTNASGWSTIGMRGNQSQSLVMHYGGDTSNELRFGRYAADMATYQANPVTIDMDAPDGTFRVNADGSVKGGGVTLASDGNIYMNWMGDWISNRLGQDVRNGSSPTFSELYTNNWFRVNGSGGIYWQAYGGGWYMSDNTWIRSYNGKWIYTDTGIRADGNGVRTTQICDTNGANCKTPAQLAAGGGGTQQIFSGWPDAIKCTRGGTGQEYVYYISFNYSGGVKGYVSPYANNVYVYFNNDGSYNTSANTDAVCQTSMSSLVSAGRTFSFFH